jgi:hypothetical protein
MPPDRFSFLPPSIPQTAGSGRPAILFFIEKPAVLLSGDRAVMNVSEKMQLFKVI